jgi:hypothetical protein
MTRLKCLEDGGSDAPRLSEWDGRWRNVADADEPLPIPSVRADRHLFVRPRHTDHRRLGQELPLAARFGHLDEEFVRPARIKFLAKPFLSMKQEPRSHRLRFSFDLVDGTQSIESSRIRPKGGDQTSPGHAVNFEVCHFVRDSYSTKL